MGDKLNKQDRSGKDFTRAGKEVVKDTNKAKNDGVMKCESCGVEVQPAKTHKRGETRSANEAHVDHVKGKREGEAILIMDRYYAVNAMLLKNIK